MSKMSGVMIAYSFLWLIVVCRFNVIFSWLNGYIYVQYDADFDFRDECWKLICRITI